MSGWRILKARRTGDEPTPEDAEADVSRRTDKDVDAREHGDSLYVTVWGYDGDPLREYLKANADAFDRATITRGNDTGPGQQKATHYEVDDGSVEKVHSTPAHVSYEGFRPAKR